MIDILKTSPIFKSVRVFIRALFGKIFHQNLWSFVWRHQHGGRKVTGLPLKGKTITLEV